MHYDKMVTATKNGKITKNFFIPLSLKSRIRVRMENILRKTTVSKHKICNMQFRFRLRKVLGIERIERQNEVRGT